MKINQSHRFCLQGGKAYFNSNPNFNFPKNSYLNPPEYVQAAFSHMDNSSSIFAVSLRFTLTYLAGGSNTVFLVTTRGHDELRRAEILVANDAVSGSTVRFTCRCSNMIPLVPSK